MEPDLSIVDYMFGGAMGIGTWEPRGPDYEQVNEGDDWVDDRPLNPGQPPPPGPSGGSGGGGMPSGGSGGSGGGSNPLNVPNYRDPNYGRNSRNPYGDLIQEIARQIRSNVNKEKEKPVPEEEPVKPLDPGENYPGKDGAGTRKYYDADGNEIPPPLGSDPATWSPVKSDEQ